MAATCIPFVSGQAARRTFFRPRRHAQERGCRGRSDPRSASFESSVLLVKKPGKIQLQGMTCQQLLLIYTPAFPKGGIALCTESLGWFLQLLWVWWGPLPSPRKKNKAKRAKSKSSRKT